MPSSDPPKAPSPVTITLELTPSTYEFRHDGATELNMNSEETQLSPLHLAFLTQPQLSIRCLWCFPQGPACLLLPIPPWLHPPVPRLGQVFSFFKFLYLAASSCIHTHTHTHTHIYIYSFVSDCAGSSLPHGIFSDCG